MTGPSHSDALNVTEVREAWDADGVTVWVEGDDWWGLIGSVVLPMTMGTTLIGLMVAFLVGQMTATTALLVAGLATLAFGLCASMAVRFDPVDVEIALRPSTLRVDAVTVPLEDITEVSWARRRLHIRRRDGGLHFSRLAYPRDPERLLRLIRSHLPAEDKGARDALLDELGPLLDR